MITDYYHTVHWYTIELAILHLHLWNSIITTLKSALLCKKYFPILIFGIKFEHKLCSILSNSNLQSLLLIFLLQVEKLWYVRAINVKFLGGENWHGGILTILWQKSQYLLMIWGHKSWVCTKLWLTLSDLMFCVLSAKHSKKWRGEMMKLFHNHEIIQNVHGTKNYLFHQNFHKIQSRSLYFSNKTLRSGSTHSRSLSTLIFSHTPRYWNEWMKTSSCQWKMFFHIILKLPGTRWTKLKCGFMASFHQ